MATDDADDADDDDNDDGVDVYVQAYIFSLDNVMYFLLIAFTYCCCL